MAQISTTPPYDMRSGDLAFRPPGVGRLGTRGGALRAPQKHWQLWASMVSKNTVGRQWKLLD
ncbi:MAG: hypothetical protein ACI9R3_001534 [Verrucomicrobiales bacterium]|jgi:hypothetical protein